MKKQFSVPGMYHPILVNKISSKKLNDNEKELVFADYDHNKSIINVDDALAPPVKLHTFYHELSHHIIMTLKNMKNEEDRCDLLASYLINLSDNRDKIKKNLK